MLTPLLASLLADKSGDSIDHGETAITMLVWWWSSSQQRAKGRRQRQVSSTCRVQSALRVTNTFGPRWKDTYSSFKETYPSVRMSEDFQLLDFANRACSIMYTLDHCDLIGHVHIPDISDIRIFPLHEGAGTQG